MDQAKFFQKPHVASERSKSHIPVATFRLDQGSQRSKSETFHDRVITPLRIPIRESKPGVLRTAESGSAKVPGSSKTIQVEIIDLDADDVTPPPAPMKTGYSNEQAALVRPGNPTQPTTSMQTQISTQSKPPALSEAFTQPAAFMLSEGPTESTSTNARETLQTELEDSPPPEVICVRKVQRSQFQTVQRPNSSDRHQSRSNNIAPGETTTDPMQVSSLSEAQHVQKKRKSTSPPIHMPAVKRQALAPTTQNEEMPPGAEKVKYDDALEIPKPSLLSSQDALTDQQRSPVKPTNHSPVDILTSPYKTVEDIAKSPKTSVSELLASPTSGLELSSVPKQRTNQPVTPPMGDSPATLTFEPTVAARNVAPVAVMSTQDATSIEDASTQCTTHYWSTRQYLDLAEMAFQSFPFEEYYQKHNKDYQEIREVFQAVVLTPVLSKGERMTSLSESCYGELKMKEWNASQREMIEASREKDRQDKRNEMADEERLMQVGWKDFDTCSKCKMRPVTKPFCMMCGKKTMYRPTTIVEAREYVKFLIREYNKAMKIYEAKIEKEKKCGGSVSGGSLRS